MSDSTRNLVNEVDERIANNIGGLPVPSDYTPRQLETLGFDPHKQITVPPPGAPAPLDDSMAPEDFADLSRKLIGQGAPIPRAGERTFEAWERVVAIVRTRMLIVLGRELPNVRLDEIRVARKIEPPRNHVSILFRTFSLRVPYDDLESRGYGPLLQGVPIDSGAPINNCAQFLLERVDQEIEKWDWTKE